MSSWRLHRRLFFLGNGIADCLFLDDGIAGRYVLAMASRTVCSCFDFRACAVEGPTWSRPHRTTSARPKTARPLLIAACRHRGGPGGKQLARRRRLQESVHSAPSYDPFTRKAPPRADEALAPLVLIAAVDM